MILNQLVIDFRNRLDRLKASVFLNEGRKLSMEELLEMILDEYEAIQSKGVQKKK
ncbi:MAG TPA: hypothetical protein VFJ51_00340 [Nitrososphaeraceae archaeon]|nr:hypothetical protein [Nitrososphaeraceae archaeon]